VHDTLAKFRHCARDLLCGSKWALQGPKLVGLGTDSGSRLRSFRLSCALRWKILSRAPVQHSPAQYNEQRQSREQRGRTIAETGVGRRRDRARQRRVQHPFDAKRQRSDHTAERIDDGGNPSVGRAHQRQALLDGTHACLQQMLVWTAADSEPAVIGQIEQPPRSKAEAEQEVRRAKPWARGGPLQ